MAVGESKLTFLRQSGWLAIATAIAGITSYAVHPFIQKSPDYGAFNAMLQLLNLIAIPAIGLQAVFAHKAAEAKTDEDAHRLAREQIAISVIVIALAAVAVACVHLNGDALVKSMKLPSLNVLSVTLASGVFALLLPMVYGVLQGRERFFWLGWAMLSLGVVRLAAVAGLSLTYGVSALNGMVGVALGFLCAFLLAGTTSGLPVLKPREWLPSVTQTDWHALLKKFVPLSMGAGAGIFMMSADMLVVQRFFDEKQTGLYGAAGMIGRALIFFVAPMVAVMFPKIVRSRAEQKPTDVLRLTLLLTVGLCVVAGGLGWWVPELPLKLVYDEQYLVVAPLVTWFIWAMIPLAMSVVLVNSLLARSDYAVAYALPVVCAGYAVALVNAAPGLAEQTTVFNVQAYIGVVKIIGLSNLAFLAVAGLFTWRHYRSSTNAAEAR